MKDERRTCGTPEITKVVAATKRGFLVVYYCGDRQVASESYDLKGVLVYCSGSIPDGVVRQYYGNHRVKEETEFRDGRAHGRSTKYYPEGETLEESTYTRGMKHGPAKTYLREGQLWLEAHYKNGKLHGTFTSYHDNGNVESEVHYRNGEPHGFHATYDRCGNLVEEGRFGQGKATTMRMREWSQSGGKACLEAG